MYSWWNRLHFPVHKFKHVCLTISGLQQQPLLTEISEYFINNNEIKINHTIRILRTFLAFPSWPLLGNQEGIR